MVQYDLERELPSKQARLSKEQEETRPPQPELGETDKPNQVPVDLWRERALKVTREVRRRDGDCQANSECETLKEFWNVHRWKKEKSQGNEEIGQWRQKDEGSSSFHVSGSAGHLENASFPDILRRIIRSIPFSVNTTPTTTVFIMAIATQSFTVHTIFNIKSTSKQPKRCGEVLSLTDA